MLEGVRRNREEGEEKGKEWRYCGGRGERKR
jgi:hypothetical protein